MGIGQRYVRNSASMLVQVVATAVVGLALPPIIVGRLGFAEYGVWATISLVLSYVTLLDLGLQSAIMREVADGRARKDEIKISQAVFRPLAIYSIITILVLSTSLAAGAVLSHIGAAWYRNWPAGQTFALLSFACLNLMAMPFSGFLRGVQAIAEANMIDMAALIGNAAVTVVALYTIGGLWSLVLGVGAGSLIRFSLCGLRAHALSGGSLRYEATWRGQARTSFLRLSTMDLSIRIHSVITQSITRLGLTHWVGTAATGQYDIGKRVAGQFVGLGASIFLPLAPVATTLLATGNMPSLRELLERNVRGMMVLGLSTVIFVSVFAQRLVEVWLGVGDAAGVAPVLQVLTIAGFIDVLSGPATIVAFAMGNVKVHLGKLGTAILLHVLFVPIAMVNWGLKGAVCVEGAAIILSIVVGIRIFETVSGINYSQIVARECARTLLISALPPLGLLLLLRTIPELSIWSSLWTWAAIGLLNAMLSTLGLFLTGVVKRDEVGFLARALSMKGSVS